MATGTPSGRRRLTINLPHVHLWIAHPGAIWSLDDSGGDTSGSYPAKRSAGGTTPGILRDDRSALARIYALSAAWYMPDVNLRGQPVGAHRNASWTIRACTDIPSSADYDGGGIVYPSLGKVIEQLSACGEVHGLNTPISSVVYDNTNGTTTIATDWQDLDVRNV